MPAAGLGTRFLPATKAVPSELLPVVYTRGIELVAAEATDGGAERLVIVTSEGKDGVIAHFVEDLVLEGAVEARGNQVHVVAHRGTRHDLGNPGGHLKAAVDLRWIVMTMAWNCAAGWLHD